MYMIRPVVVIPDPLKRVVDVRRVGFGNGAEIEREAGLLQIALERDDGQVGSGPIRVAIRGDRVIVCDCFWRDGCERCR